MSSGTCQRGVTQPCAQKMVPSAGSERTRATRCRVASLAFAAASNAGGAFRKHRRRCSVLNCRTKLTANYNLLGNGRNYDIIHAASICERAAAQILHSPHFGIGVGFVSAVTHVQICFAMCPFCMFHRIVDQSWTWPLEVGTGPLPPRRAASLLFERHLFARRDNQFQFRGREIDREKKAARGRGWQLLS